MRSVEADYNGYHYRLAAEPTSDGRWKPSAVVQLRLGNAVVPKSVVIEKTFRSEDEAVDFAIAYVRGKIDRHELT